MGEWNVGHLINCQSPSWLKEEQTSQQIVHRGDTVRKYLRERSLRDESQAKMEEEGLQVSSIFE
jgi:hypothetical protein